MKVLVTRQNTDGSYDECGMNNRRLIELKTERGVVNRCLRTGFCKPGDKVRLQWYWDPLYRPLRPYATTDVVLEPAQRELSTI